MVPLECTPSIWLQEWMILSELIFLFCEEVVPNLIFFYAISLLIPLDFYGDIFVLLLHSFPVI